MIIIDFYRFWVMNTDESNDINQIFSAVCSVCLVKQFHLIFPLRSLEHQSYCENEKLTKGRKVFPVSLIISCSLLDKLEGGSLEKWIKNLVIY